MMSPSGEAPNARWIALAVTMLAGSLASIQSTSLIVALTNLIVALNADFLTIMWVMLAFMAAVAAVCPMLGFLADSGIKGSRCFMFNVGFAIFGVASFLCGFSQPSAKGVDLVMYRALMGIGAAFIFNNSAPILADKFHPYNQVGLAQGLWGMSFALGSIIGPVVGGGLLQAGWQWIFFFNVPFCALGCALGFWKVKDAPVEGVVAENSPKLKQMLKLFDFNGALTSTVGLICLFLAITTSIFPGGNLQGDTVVALLSFFAAVLLIEFLICEWKLQGNYPIIDFSMFKSKDFSLLVLGSLALAIARGSLTFGFIFYFQGARGQDPLGAGIAVIPQGVGTFIFGAISGRLTDKYGYRTLCVAGSLLGAAGALGACFITKDTTYWAVAACLFIAGAGMGIYNSPSSTLGVLCIKPNRRGSSNALRFMITLVAQMIAIVICFKLIVGSLPGEIVYLLFVYGGTEVQALLGDGPLNTFVKGFNNVMWIVFVGQLFLAVTSIPLTKAAIKMQISPPASPEPEKQKEVLDAAKKIELQPAESNEHRETEFEPPVTNRLDSTAVSGSE
jgi:MFS family permease